MKKKGFNDIIIIFVAFSALVILFTVLIVFSFFDDPVNSCIFPAEVDCLGYQTQNSTHETITIQLKNNLNENLTVERAEIIGSNCNYGMSLISNSSKSWAAREVLWLSFHCMNLSTDGKYAVVSLKLRSEYDYLPLRFTGKVKYYK